MREKRVEIFEETKRLYCTNKRLIDSIELSRKEQKVIGEDVQISVPADRYQVPANIVVSQKKPCGSKAVSGSERLRT